MKLFVLLFSILFQTMAFACEVHLPHHIVILGKLTDFRSAIVQEGCPEATLQEIDQTLVGLEGKITSSHLTQILNSKNMEAKIAPHMIQVQQFNQIVRDQLVLPPGVQMRSSEVLNAQNFITLAPGDRIEVQCIGCLYGTGQTLNVNIRGFDGADRSLTVRADFKKFVKAYRILSFMPAFSDVSSNILKEEYVDSIPHTDLVTNLETLKFYKLNKPIKAGELLRQSDLNAVNLVKAGLKTEVIIENELVRLKTNGISRSNGTLGEFVEVFSPEKNKKYQGKVIDINKVLVEL